MADLRELATYSEDTGTYTTILSLEDTDTYQAVRGSFQVKRGQRQQSLARSQRRYAGSVIAGEQLENAEVTWKAVVRGASVDLALGALEDMFAALETARTDLYLAWKPDGATQKTLYEIRGPATWQPEHDWAQLTQNGAETVTVSIPVAPLPLTDSVTDLSASFPTTLPAVYSPATDVPGTAPALATLQVRATGGSAAPVWALIGWTKRPGSPLASSVAPFGLIEAETYTSVSTWAKTLADSNYSGSDGVRTTTSGAGSANAQYAVDPSVMQPDDFTAGTIDIEVWARIELAAGVVSPKLVLSLEPNAGASFGASQYSAEYGANGKLLTLPSSGTRFRFVKLGTLTMPVDPAQPLKWNAKLAASWAGGSSGSFGVDYLIMVPARQRAVSRCGVANDGYFPQFIPSTSDTTKQIRPDLSGRIASGTGNKGPHTGLGGAPLELPPGPVDVVVKLSSLVADDPSSSAASEQKTHGLTSGLIRVRPRWFYGRDA